MLAHGEMENPNFSYAKKCSNDRVPSQHSASAFIEYWGYIGCPIGYSTLIFHMATIDCFILKA